MLIFLQPCSDYEKQIAAVVAVSEDHDAHPDEDSTKSLQHVDLNEVS